jgi:hypothetical protein
MKKLASFIIITLLFGLTAFQCGEQKDCCVMPPCSEIATLTGTWRLESYRNTSTGAEVKDPAPEGKGVVFTFKDDMHDGTIEGHTFVNEISGKYEFSAECSIKITEFGGTKVGEPGWSDGAWLDAGNTAFYQVVGDKLTLRFMNSTKSMVFKKAGK